MSSLEPAEFEKFNAVCETLSKKNGAFLIANEHMVGVRFVNHENSHNGTHYENNNSYDTLYIKDGKLKRKIELKVRGISRLPQEADVAEFCSAVEKGERPTQSLASPDLSSMPVFNIPKLGI